ncbi:VaFE repeat-containing surface-anchored protein [Arthrobacter sp. ERGS1:01]|uniref:VaFE repeat-containing surface-anchored protein n=1 Tax=Arthrobacter sp. ERGS1:01 TaxID=1704044 RepID=UPI001364CDF0|nr:VaFE repeat-containing surface-anchored protein [Arthrobacter sp. ERGS1:01]
MFPVWYKTPAVGEPDAWAYCIEHDVHANSNVEGHVGGFDEYLGANYFTDPTIQGRVLWVLAHSYPAMTLADLEAATGIAGLSVNDAIEATQYAIWRYTELDYDASWNWESPNSEAVYWYLVNGANTNPVMKPSDVQVTASITAPSSAQTSDSIVGPFVVNTNQKSVIVSAPGFNFTDASGNPIDPTAVVDGQKIYLDLRGHVAAGSTTVTVTAAAAGPTGGIISVPRTDGSTPTTGDHAQSIVLVQAKTATVGDRADISWTEKAPAVSNPVIGTSLVDSADGDRVLSWNGGTVIDTVAYQNLTPGVKYTVSGELMNKADGTGTGITGSTTFTPTEANGSTDVAFTVPEGYAGDVLVAYEQLFEGSKTTGKPAAVHKDINDAAQTVTVEKAPAVSNPVIGTSLVDSADGDRVLSWNGGTVIDTVAYQNLTPGVKYTVSGELMNKADGTGTGITGSTTFTPTEANGSTDVAFTVPEGYAGDVLVAYEQLFEGSKTTGKPAAVHKDINDAAQTVTVEKAPAVSNPVIGTSLVDSADGDRVLSWNGGTVIDTVAYQNLTPGVKYTVSGELMNKADGTGTGITGSTTFTPTEANGSTDVAFTVPEGYAGDVLVAYEQLFEGSKTTGKPAAVHKDINDAAQTVTVEKAPAVTPIGPKHDVLAVTGGTFPGYVIGMASLLLLLGAAARLAPRTRRKL